MPRHVNLEISNNRIDFTTRRLIIEILDGFKIVSIKSTNNGLKATLYSKNFTNASTWSCVFDGISSTVKILKENHVDCTNVGQRYKSRIIFKVCHKMSYCSVDTILEVEEDFRLTKVEPLYVPIAGGIVVQIASNYVLDRGSTYHFGHDKVMVDHGIDLLGNVFYSCVTPKIIVPQTVNLVISTNGIDFTTNVMHFTFLADMEFVSVFPYHVKSNEESMIHLHGINIPNAKALSCTFNDEISSTAKWVSNVEVWCITPGLIPGPNSAQLKMKTLYFHQMFFVSS